MHALGRRQSVWHHCQRQLRFMSGSGNGAAIPLAGMSTQDPSDPLMMQKDTSKYQQNAMQLIRAFKQSGHLVADLDPLDLESSLPELKRRRHGDRWQKKPHFENVNLGDMNAWLQNLNGEEIDGLPTFRESFQKGSKLGTTACRPASVMRIHKPTPSS